MILFYCPNCGQVHTCTCESGYCISCGDYVVATQVPEGTPCTIQALIKVNLGEEA